MNPVAKKIWVDTLRQNGDKQITGQLFGRNDCFCAMGALMHGFCETKNLSLDHNIWTHERELHNWISADEKFSILWGPKVKHEGIEYNVASLNDDLGLSFEQIAELIEQQIVESPCNLSDDTTQAVVTE